MAHLLLADASDLENWAKRRAAQDTLPQLVRRLAYATVPHIQRIEFRAGEGVQLPGWDGIVVVEEGNAFVPKGLSVWELGTGKDVKSKADDDYKKRSEDPREIESAHATFVFLTARRWPGKDAWVNERVSEGIWHGVKAYDADDLETWLETAPAVHVWLSILISKRPEGVVDADTYWKDWSAATSPATSAELVLAGRDEPVKAIYAWLENPEYSLVLQADSDNEALAVFAAALQSLPPDKQTDALSRTVIVRDAGAWGRLLDSCQRLILVPKFQCGSASLAGAMRRGHSAVVTRVRAKEASPGTIDVPRISREEAAKALVAMGISAQRSGDLATLARRSLTALRRKISVIPDIEQPAWARPESARSLLAALFAGRWSSAVEGDREVLAEFAGTSYDEVQAGVVRWSNEDDPPVRCVGDAWYLTDEEDAWSLLARYVTRDDLQRFQKVVVDVLGTPDPALDLAEDRRWMAGALGHAPRHSGLLKTGLGNTLAIMGARAEALQTTGEMRLSGYASDCVQRILRTNDWKVWASAPLPVLAEAAPDEFLNAVDPGLAGEPPTLLGLFQDESDDLFSSPRHIDLLWALERLAWSEDHLVRATSALGELARLDPGGRWSNRPQNSLRAIFLLWFPETSAPLDRRLSALDNLRGLVPEVAWKLMDDLLPKRPDHQNHTNRPRWRDWAPEGEVRPTTAECAKASHELLVRMLKDVGVDGVRWGDLIDALPQLRQEGFEAVVTKLGSLDTVGMQPTDSASVWNALRTFVSRHRSYRDADSSLWNAEVERLADMLAGFEPTEPLLRFSWLFGNSPALPEGREEDYKTYDRLLASRQIGAVQTMHEEQGLQWVSGFVESVELPDLLGAVVARSSIAHHVEDDLLRKYNRPDETVYQRFVNGFVGQMVHQVGLDWAKQKLADLGAQWSAEQRAAFCVSLRFDSTTWELVRGLDDATRCEYWKTVPPFRVSDTDVEDAARQLLEHNRPHIAVHLLQRHVRAAKISSNLVADALDQFVHFVPDQKDQRRLSTHELSELLTFVSNSSGVEEGRVARLEWALLPALGRHEYKPKLLHRELARKPKFFAQVVGFVYRSEGEEPSEQSDQEQAQGMHAYELLQSWRWRPLPGMPEDGDFDPVAMGDWVRAAREILRAEGLLESGDLTIGEVLSGSPGDDDGAWPISAVRDLIEELQSDDFEEGIMFGMLNSEDPTWRNPDDGGARERKESEKYDQWARTVSGRWGRTAAMLRRISDTYRRRAHDEDQSAELRDDLSP